ncbi:hypothetical protein CEK25_005972 [Fusarium fujikuroi]|nr:hypothetical protein CEK25_005972 [Fusarium fujikuroi]
MAWTLPGRRRRRYEDEGNVRDDTRTWTPRTSSITDRREQKTVPDTENLVDHAEVTNRDRPRHKNIDVEDHEDDTVKATQDVTIDGGDDETISRDLDDGGAHWPFAKRRLFRRTGPEKPKEKPNFGSTGEAASNSVAQADGAITLKFTAASNSEAQAVATRCTLKLFEPSKARILSTRYARELLAFIGREIVELMDFSPRSS